MARRFTVREAERILPQVREWMREAVTMKLQYDRAEHAVQALSQRITMMGGIVVDRERASEDRERREVAGQALRTLLESFEESGVVVKDLDSGWRTFRRYSGARKFTFAGSWTRQGSRFGMGCMRGLRGGRRLTRIFWIIMRGSRRSNWRGARPRRSIAGKMRGTCRSFDIGRCTNLAKSQV